MFISKVRPFGFAFLFILFLTAQDLKADEIALVANCAQVAGATFNSNRESGTSPSCTVIYNGQEVTFYDSDQLESYVNGTNPDFPVTPRATAESTTPAANNTTTGSVDPCSQLIDQIKACVDTSKTAEESSCNPQANGQMTSVMGMAKTMTNQASMATAASIEAACSQMGSLAAMANEALLGFEAYCQISQTDCSNACQQADSMVKSYQTTCQSQGVTIDTSGLASSKRSCARAGNALADAGVQMQNMMAQKMNSQQCKNLAGNSMDAYCKANPGNILCANAKNVNCSDPAVASSNTVCICNTNPRDPRCSQAGIAAAGVNTVSPNGGSSSSSSASSKLAGGGPNFNLGGTDGGDIFGAGAGPSGPNGGPGGGPAGRGANRNINGGGDAAHTAGAKGQGAGGSAGNAFNTKVNGGYYGGGGGGGFSSGGSSAGGVGSGGYNKGYVIGGPGKLNGQQLGKIDLRQFLPGGRMDPSRGLAGIAGPDGITGPNSDIWQKVNNRYQAVSASLKH